MGLGMMNILIHNALSCCRSRSPALPPRLCDHAAPTTPLPSYLLTQLSAMTKRPTPYLRSGDPKRVISLAKASDISPDFYIGIPGTVVEANISLFGTQIFDGILGSADKRVADGSQTSGGCATRPLSAMVMEVGDSLHSFSNSRPGFALQTLV
ncbi:hypothetical protein CONLIGDRAFT_685905 [Coniochaeta ligniaria NRRL 30616]|uniref:Uncharacterized protein n=1 Tax=Coniochaeta ligniaria NRRL 30616 TaxID=1408157 RepID=A0A1J7IAE9_9PEZI|nr:hypothetical protein CONLIGDRAFT_685905 [Coniochaeta ligniaria NRRL 30616]